MDNMMKGIKGMFGGSSGSKMPKSGGHVLGGAPPPAEQRKTLASSHREAYDITFASKSLGMSLKPSETGGVVVSNVTTGSEAQRAGVRTGDLLVGLEGNPVASYEVCVDLIKHMDRPVRVSFSRAIQPPTQKPGRGASSSSSSSKALTQAEQANRREQALKAAETRGKAWDKRVTSQRSARVQKQQAQQGSVGVQDNTPQSAESRAAFEAAKQREANETAQLGYNPYQPIFGSSTQGRNAIMQSEAQGNGQGASPPEQSFSDTGSHQSRAPVPVDIPPPSRSAADTERPTAPLAITEELEHALSVLVSHESAVVTSAIDTMLKLLENLAKNFAEEKYHKVRLANKTFNSKVGEVSGGIEVMVQAGFIMSTDSSSNEPILMCPMGAEPAGELFNVIGHLKSIRARY